MNAPRALSTGAAALAGLRGRCPACAKGRLFDGYIAVRPACEVCGLDYGFADSGDGPAVFVTLIAGFMALGFALWFEFTYNPPFWAHFVVSLPLVTIVCLVMLRAFKGVLIALQHHNAASEGRIDE